MIGVELLARSARAAQIGDHVGQVLRTQVFLEPFGHQRFSGVLQPFEVGAEDRLALAFLAQQRDAVAGFSCQHAIGRQA